MYALIFVTMFGNTITEKEIETYDTYKECNEARIMYNANSFRNEIFICQKKEGK